ncbi:hypothetical protein [Stenotrophomonas maltophilia]|uniref:hypothetical protein n=1 Tax=Stenotrophomonas maltophilia group TaxID=995085 RepID=UPI001013D43E|nr:hypothetical protein [Stenotrophomonas maltophilia]NNH49545.1 hypothetical protein [Stenotrophomonas maltophilia]
MISHIEVNGTQQLRDQALVIGTETYRQSNTHRKFAQPIARAERALRILESYSEHEQVVVFSHGQLMQAMRWIHENKAPSMVIPAAMGAFRKPYLDQSIAHCQRVFFE